MRAAWSLVALALVLLPGVGVAGETPPAVVTIAPSAMKTMGIATTIARAGTLSGHIACPAYVMADNRHVVRISPLGEGRVLKVLTYPGQIVAAGQVLLEYDNHTLVQLRQQIAAAEAALEEARATRDEAALSAARAKILRGTVLAVGEVQRRELALRHAEGLVREKKALLDSSQVRLDELTSATERPDGEQSRIISPIPGIVRGVNVAMGDNMANRTQPLVEVDDLSSVWVVSQVLGRDAGALAPGNRQVTHPGGRSTQAIASRIDTIDGNVDPQTRQLLVRSLVPNKSGRLRPGMLVTTELYASTPVEGVLVPATAVQELDGAQAVFVRVASDRYAAREVTTGPEAGGMLVVTHGLTPGDVVVTAGSFTLKSQMLLTRVGGG
ncbi:efflux RND transporter periplasmic adaptor subunit [Gluconacetobacter sp. Hr-1-5]|uniref:efflux RND transporter periplasmic adaptor subunit n=1 Tax=Gluconacetobacter sp. Hr-1-5 TaxID=3395370 RepID=UPI003B52E0FE